MQNAVAAAKMIRIVLSKAAIILLTVHVAESCLSAQTQQNPGAQSEPQQQGASSNIPEKRIPATDHIWITNTTTDTTRDEADQRLTNPAGTSTPTAVQPEPKPSEFQKFVLLSTGQQLPMFGYDLFRIPTTFAPLDRVPVTADYVVGPGDEVVIRGWGQIDIDYHGIVDRTGNLYLPKVGSISLAGVQYKDLQPVIKASIARFYHGFELTVTLGHLRSIQVFVVGQARRPGSYTVSSLSTLVNAIFASGGPSYSGSMRRIQLKRNGRVVTEFDLYDLFLNGDKSKDVQLLTGDVIYIPPVGPLVAMVGSLNNPAVYEIKGTTTLAEMLQIAGGLTSVTAGQQATIERIKDRQARLVEEITLDQTGLGQRLQDGDVVTLRTLSARFDQSVTLRGNVAMPGRYSWKQGMRVKDLIPSREALITRQFWWEQGNLGRAPIDLSNWKIDTSTPSTNAVITENPGTQTVTGENPSLRPPNGEPPPGNAAPASIAEKKPSGLSTSGIGSNFADEIRRNAPDINWQYALIQRLDAGSLTIRLLPFNLGNAIDGPDSNPDNLELQPRDVITIFSQADLQVPEQKRTKLVRLEGEFVTAGIYEAQTGETLRQLVKRVGGITPKAFLFGSEFLRESAREIQQKRLDELVNQFEIEVEREGSNKSQNVLSPEEAVGLSQRLEAQRALVARLKQVRASGRVILGTKPSDNDIDALPDLVLEDGDRFVVPYKPEIVNVVGAVYNNNSFVFQNSRSFNYYLHRAGGGTRDADRRHSFVVRADGSVLNENRSMGWFNGGIESVKLLPGDTIVVPEKIDRTTFIKGLKDWSQILAQFGLGAAAVVTLTR